MQTTTRKINPVDMKPLPTQEKWRPHHSFKKILMVAIGIFLVALIAALVYWLNKKPTTAVTPEQELQALEDASRPITLTTEERATMMAEFEKSSSKDTQTKEENLQELEKLSN